MLEYIPKPNVGLDQFSTGANSRTINDNKAASRLDFNSSRYGTSSIYYFNDCYRLDDPYPSGLGGATLPGNGFAYDTFSFGVDQTLIDPYNYHALDGVSAFDLKHNFVVSYNYELPTGHILPVNRFTQGWALSGVTRFASGLPVTFATFSDNYLVQVQNNGVNATSIDMPNYNGSGYKINHNPRNGRPYFNTAAITPNTLARRGTPGAYVLRTRNRELRHGPAQGDEVQRKPFA
jgi:hypothetical protein